MSTDVRINDRPKGCAAVRDELSLAKLRAPQKTWDGGIVPAGTTGTIVEVLGNGREYVLDFVEPHNAVATVLADQLEDAVEA